MSHLSEGDSALIAEQEMHIAKKAPILPPSLFSLLQSNPRTAKKALPIATTIPISEFESMKKRFQRNNSRPSTVQNQIFTALVAQEAIGISQINERILDIQIEIDRLLTKINFEFEARAQRERKILDYEAVRAPARFLPPEILTRMFEYSLSELDLQTSLRHMAGVLCAVCFAWRDAALGHPRLWLIIFRNERPFLGPFVGHYFKLQRDGRGKPLRFMFQFDTCSRLTNEQLSATIYKSFFSYFPSLTEITIEKLNFGLAGFLSLPAGSIPTVVNFSLTCVETFNPEDKETVILQEPTIFRGATSLRCLKLGLEWNAFDLWNFHSLPWGQLHDLDLKKVPFPLFSELIVQCTNLRTAIFHVGDEGDRSTTIHTLPHLSDLKIYIQHVVDVDQFLSKLNLPMLRNLAVGSLSGPHVMLNRIMCPETPALASIRHLRIIRVHIQDDDSFLNLICACTKIETIELYAHRESPFSCSDIICMFTRLCAMPGRLEALHKLSLVYRPSSKRDVTEDLALVKKFGELVGAWKEARTAPQGHVPRLRRQGVFLRLVVITQHHENSEVTSAVQGLSVRFPKSDAGQDEREEIEQVSFQVRLFSRQSRLAQNILALLNM
ncbi:hypothetical protein H0H81_010087 [Sphagnurus paluster]|uniref:F-box domain-containing protein n=1 Tax=Sphagnurus paluster TaxID=117069 RepID=A0A9P7FRQ6_9AGAR|nr:hypothetical protein H0H81_010087 [Sphagnurus paluster]